jgi:hypothetical protein
LLLEETPDVWRVAVLDLYLRDPSWTDELREDPISLSEIAIEARVADACEGAANFLEALQRFAELNPSETGEARRSGGGFDHLPATTPVLVRDPREPGVLIAEHFESVPIRMAALSLLLAIEVAIIERAGESSENANGAVSSLPPRSRAASEKLAASKNPMNILDASYFRDKLQVAIDMRWCHPVDIGRLNRVRNWCAHTGTGGAETVWIDDVLHAAEQARSLLLDLQAPG